MIGWEFGGTALLGSPCVHCRQQAHRELEQRTARYEPPSPLDVDSTDVSADHHEFALSSWPVLGTLESSIQPLSITMGTIRMKIDVVHVVDGVPPNVAEAKHVMETATDCSNADHYQMLAYCAALRVPVAWLIYAYGASGARRWILKSDIELVEYPLDLDEAPTYSSDKSRRLRSRHGKVDERAGRC